MAKGSQSLIFEPVTQDDVIRFQNATSPMAPVTMDDMVKDFETFKVYNEMGAFDSDMSAAEMVGTGVKAMATDTWAWLSGFPGRLANIWPCISPERAIRLAALAVLATW